MSGYTRLNNPHVGDFYTASWTASTSSAPNTRLSNMTSPLPAGTYIVTAKFPTISTSDFTASIVGANDGNLYIHGPSWESASYVTTVNEGAQLYINSSQSAKCDFTALERGLLRATRLK